MVIYYQYISSNLLSRAVNALSASCTILIVNLHIVKQLRQNFHQYLSQLGLLSFSLKIRWIIRNFVHLLFFSAAFLLKTFFHRFVACITLTVSP